MTASRTTAAAAVLACLLANAAPTFAGTGEPAPAVAGARARDAFAQGGTGFREAAVRSKASGKPLFLYFYTDWCGYCRQFEKELLSTAEVIAALAEYEPVAINPEKGEEAMALGDSYGVQSYPALMVQLPGPQGPARVRRTVAAGGAQRLMTPQEFVQALGAATAAARGGS
jgi:thiol:disulfide interchange protein